MSRPLPDFYEPGRVGELYLERASLVAESAARERVGHPVAPSREDAFRIAAFGVDCQVAFCMPGASLFVPGAVEDTVRTIEWLYRNLGVLTRLFFTLDTHTVFQIFHPTSWVNAEGGHPAPFSVITARDVREGRWIPLLRDEAFPDARGWALEYCEKLEGTGRYVLTIWPYHALLGGLSHALVPALMEASLFHSILRGVDPVFEIKGRSPVTENYSVFKPEVTELQGRPVGAFNRTLFETVMTYDRVYVFGQAKSHCVLESLRDIQQTCQEDRRLLQKIWILEDAMSPVPPPPLEPLPPELDFPRVADRAMAEFGKSGMRICRTTDPVPIPA